MKILVRPIYGWGWTDGGGQPVEMPCPFELEISGSPDQSAFAVAVGQLPENTDHPLSGLWIRLSQRHAILDGNYNLIASDEKLRRDAAVSHEKPTFKFAGYAMANITQQ